MLKKIIATIVFMGLLSILLIVIPVFEYYERGSFIFIGCLLTVGVIVALFNKENIT